MNFKQQQQQHSQRTNHPHETINNHTISQRNNSKLSPNHFIRSPTRPLSSTQPSSSGSESHFQQPHFLNRPQFPTHTPLQITNQFNPLAYSARLSYIPNSYHVSYHQAPNSIHSRCGLPALDLPNGHPIQSSFESPHSSPSSTNTLYPIPSILNSPRTPLSKMAHQDSNQDQPERIVTGILRSSLPSQQRPDHQSISQTRPQSMTFTELSARHRAAISQFQQKTFQTKEYSTQSNSSSLNKSFSSPTTSSTHSSNRSNLIKSSTNSIHQNKSIKIEKDSSKRRKSNESHHESISSDQIPMNSLNHHSNLSPFVKSLKQIKSGKRLSETNLLNQDEMKLLHLLPPLPPSSSTALINQKLKPLEKKSIQNETKIRFKDRFSWFDY